MPVALPFRMPVLIAMIAMVTLAVSCTEAKLYDPNELPSLADKVAFSGTVCTDNPAERSFPLRVVFVVDVSAALSPTITPSELSSLTLQRSAAIRDAVNSLRAPDAAFSLVRFGGDVQAVPDGTFTNNVSTIIDAADALSVVSPCTGDGCRLSGQALSLASSIISGDAGATAPGPRSRTKYVMVWMQNGPVQDLILDGATSPGCDSRCVLTERVRSLRDSVRATGAADVQLLALDIASVTTDAPYRDATALVLQEMAAAGAGEYAPVCARGPDGSSIRPGCGAADLSLNGLDINSARNVFLQKSFVISNRNAITRTNGTTVPDSDADGLADEDEPAVGTDPTRRDTDGDGLSDLVEHLLSTTGIDPLVADDPPSCRSIEVSVRTVQDLDGDGLTDCEEALLRLDATLFDTDRDGVPDPIELSAGTNFLADDVLDDFDYDGAINVDELRGHTDPRSADTKTRNELSYLYRETDLGIRPLLFAAQPRAISGVIIEEVFSGTNTGNGQLSVIRDPSGVYLSYRDASSEETGPAIFAGDGGVLRLPAACPPGEDCQRGITVNVTAQLLPPASIDELIRIAAAERQCTQFRVRNITLVPTIAADNKAAGDNDVRIFFGQVPDGVDDAFAIFRVAQFSYNFQAPNVKTPNITEQLVEDFRFVLFE